MEPGIKVLSSVDAGVMTSSHPDRLHKYTFSYHCQPIIIIYYTLKYLLNTPQTTTKNPSHNKTPKSKGKITNLLWLLQSKNTTKQQFKFRIASCLHTLTQSQFSYPFHHGSMCTCCISRRCAVQQHIQLPVRIHTHGTNKKTHNWTYICTHTTKHTLGFYITWKLKLSTQMHNLCVKTDTWWLSLIYWYHYHLNIHFRFRLHLAEFTTRFV